MCPLKEPTDSVGQMLTLQSHIALCIHVFLGAGEYAHL